MIPLCLAEGIGLIPWSPLARGVLARRPNETTTRAATDDFARQLYDTPGDTEVVTAVLGVAAARGISQAEVALSWLLGRPGVVAPIVGATRLEDLETAFKALDVQLTDSERRALEALYRPHAVKGHS